MIKLRIDNLGRVIDGMRKQALKGKVKPSASVEYVAPYAVYVHEDLTKSHKRGQAKYLETPAKLLRNELQSIVRAAVEADRNLEAGTIEAAQLLLEESRKLVPVDTGALKASGRIRIGSSGQFASQS